MSEVIIVLGMHRSGTSCLTGLLQQAGVELGNVVKAAAHNKKGNRENLDIMSLNNDVLSYSQGSWDSPPHHLSWNKEHQGLRDEIIESYAGKGVWGFKDPRVVLTLPFWLEGLQGADLHFMGTFRHPLAVAKSLRARQADFSIEQAVALWCRYNEILLGYQRMHEFPLINFDLEPGPYMDAVLAAIRRLGVLSLPDGNRLDFFDHALRHQIELPGAELQQFAGILESALPIYEELMANS